MTAQTPKPSDRFELVEAVELIEREVPTIDGWVIHRHRQSGGPVSVTLIHRYKGNISASDTTSARVAAERAIAKFFGRELPPVDRRRRRPQAAPTDIEPCRPSAAAAS